MHLQLLQISCFRLFVPQSTTPKQAIILAPGAYPRCKSRVHGRKTRPVATQLRLATAALASMRQMALKCSFKCKKDDPKEHIRQIAVSSRSRIVQNKAVLMMQKSVKSHFI
jgi:hypothetical protein